MNKQKGSAHVIIIIGLVVTLIGALGFVFWQNFIYKEPVATKNETMIAQKSMQDEQTESNKGYTVLPDWNVRFPSGSQKYELTKGLNDESEWYIITSEDVKKKCGSEESYIGTITRYEPDAKPFLYEGLTAREAFADSNAKVVTSEYIYIFSSPQSACSEDAQVMEDVTMNVSQLKAQFDKLKEF